RRQLKHSSFPRNTRRSRESGNPEFCDEDWAPASAGATLAAEDISNEVRNSVGEGIGPQLEAHHLRPRSLPAFHVERRARRDGGPQAATFPALLRIVDAPVEPFGVVAERIGHA